MKNIVKKAAVTLAALATMGALLVVPTFAQTTTTTTGNGFVGVGGFNPISQWIVLSDLFGGGMATPFGTAGTVGTTGTVTSGGALSNPISQWIVLSNLFGGPVI